MCRDDRRRRFTLAAFMSAAVACVGMLSMGGALVQTGCGPAPAVTTTPPAVTVTASSELVVGTDGSYSATLKCTATQGLTAYMYNWTANPSSGVTITQGSIGYPTPATAVFTVPGTYTFTITVKGLNYADGTATTVVTVPPFSVSTNSPLRVNRTDPATLVATAVGGVGAKTYFWAKLNGVNGVPATPFGASSTVPTTVPGATTYQVMVADSATPPNIAGWLVYVFVDPLQMNVTASATPASLALPSSSMLSCIVTEGYPPYEFYWIQRSGPGPAIVSNPWSQSTAVTFDAVGTYEFEVGVLDSSIDLCYFSQNLYHQIASSRVTVDVTSASLAFTTSPFDNLVGSSGNDTFTGTDTTLQSIDTANGGEGADTLMINLAAAIYRTLPTLSSIETISITDASVVGSTLNASQVSGLTALNFLAPAGSETVLSLNSIPAVGVTNDASAVNLTFKDSVVSGTADALTVTLNNVTAGAYDIDNNASGASSIETVNFVSTGSANTLTSLAEGPTTINVTGDKSLTMTAPNSATTISATGMTAGGVAITLGTGNVTFTGSPADDTVDDAGKYTTGDILSGGLGTDTLTLGDEDVVVAVSQSNVTGFETLCITNGMSDNVISSYWGDITTVKLPNGIDAAKTLTVPTGTTIELNETSTSIGAAVIQVPGTSTTDSVTVKIKGDFAMASTTDFSKIETVNLVADANATFTGAVTVNTAGSTRVLNLAGASGKTVTFSSAVTANVINGSALTGALAMSAATVAPLGAAITGGSGADVLYGSTSADTISTGAGATNAVYAGAGADIIICGSGVDTINYVATVDGAEIIQGFTAGTGGDVFKTNFAPTTGFGTITAVTPAAGAVILATAGSAVFSVASPLTTPTDFSSGAQVISAISGTSVSVSADQGKGMLILYSGGNAYLYEIAEGVDGDAAVAAADLTLVATFEGVAANAFVAANITN